MLDPARRSFVMSSTDSGGSAFQVHRLCICDGRIGRMRTGATATSMNSLVCSRLSALRWDLSQKQNLMMPEVWNVKQKTIFQQQLILVPGLPCSSGKLWRCTTSQPALAAKHLGKQSRHFHMNIPQSTARKTESTKKPSSMAGWKSQTHCEVAKISFANLKLSLNVVKVLMSAIQGDFTINRLQTKPKVFKCSWYRWATMFVRAFYFKQPFFAASTVDDSIRGS